MNHPGGTRSYSHTFSGNAGDVLSATATVCTDGAACTTYGSSSEFSGTANVQPLAIVKRAFLLDGTPVADSSVLPRGTLFRFLIYVNNPGGAVSDVSLLDALDAAFVYQTGTLSFDSSTPSCAAGGCTPAQEAAADAAASSGTSGTDAIDGDVLSYTAGTVAAGNQFNANAQLDLPSARVWAMVFAARIQ